MRKPTFGWGWVGVGGGGVLGERPRVAITFVSLMESCCMRDGVGAGVFYRARLVNVRNGRGNKGWSGPDEAQAGRE